MKLLFCSCRDKLASSSRSPLPIIKMRIFRPRAAVKNSKLSRSVARRVDDRHGRPKGRPSEAGPARPSQHHPLAVVPKPSTSVSATCVKIRRGRLLGRIRQPQVPDDPATMAKSVRMAATFILPPHRGKRAAPLRRHSESSPLSLRWDRRLTVLDQDQEESDLAHSSLGYRPPAPEAQVVGNFTLGLVQC